MLKLVHGELDRNRNHQELDNPCTFFIDLLRWAEQLISANFISWEGHFMVKEFLTSAIRKVTLELIYQVVNERTEELKTEICEIKSEIKEMKKRHEEDFRYLVQKIDTDMGNVRSEIGQLRGEMGQLRGEMGQLSQKIDTSTGQINQRIDTII